MNAAELAASLAALEKPDPCAVGAWTMRHRADLLAALQADDAAQARIAALLDRWYEVRAQADGDRIVQSADDRTAFDRGMDHAERLIVALLRDPALAATPSPAPAPPLDWPAKRVAGQPWPAKCRHCGLLTEDPNGFFQPTDLDSLGPSYECPSADAPDELHELERRWPAGAVKNASGPTVEALPTVQALMDYTGLIAAESARLTEPGGTAE